MCKISLRYPKIPSISSVNHILVKILILCRYPVNILQPLYLITRYDMVASSFWLPKYLPSRYLNNIECICHILLISYGENQIDPNQTTANLSWNGKSDLKSVNLTSNFLSPIYIRPLAVNETCEVAEEGGVRNARQRLVGGREGKAGTRKKRRRGERGEEKTKRNST